MSLLPTVFLHPCDSITMHGKQFRYGSIYLVILVSQGEFNVSPSKVCSLTYILLCILCCGINGILKRGYFISENLYALGAPEICVQCVWKNKQTNLKQTKRNTFHCRYYWTRNLSTFASDTCWCNISKLLINISAHRLNRLVN